MRLFGSRLERFREAQDPVWETVHAELAAGRKQTHWMWFVFPQGKGLGQSPMSKRFALSRSEARRYWRDDVLGIRLIEATTMVSYWLKRGRPLEQVLGSELDARKFRSCMELFLEVSDRALFADALRHADEAGHVEQLPGWTAVSNNGHGQVDFSIKVKRAVPTEIAQCEGATFDGEDGSAAVFVLGELVAVTDEYGTAYLRPGTNATPTKDQVENLVEGVLEFIVHVPGTVLGRPEKESG